MNTRTTRAVSQLTRDDADEFFELLGRLAANSDEAAPATRAAMAFNLCRLKALGRRIVRVYDWPDEPSLF